jgi:hypothetical protein
MCSRSFALARKSALGRCTAIAAVGGLLLIAALPALGQDRLEVAAGESAVSVKLSGQALTVYQFQPQPRKPYLKELFSPGGVNVLRDAPADHLHHHSLMFAVAVDGVDFWSENEKCGRQKHARLGQPRVHTRDGRSWCSFPQQIDWLGPDGRTLHLKEERTIDACRAGDPAATLVVWSTSLAVPPGKGSVTLTGSPYFGLGMRFVQAMDKGGAFRNADGKTGVEGTNDVRTRWCAYSAAADGKPVTVAMFDCPRNPRHPATWFTMDSPFAYLAATLHLHKEPLVIESGEPLELRYGVALWDGHVEPNTIEKAYQQFVGRASPAP